MLQRLSKSNLILPLIALMAVLVAWGSFWLGRERVSRLDFSRWGTDIDVIDQLQMDQYVSNHLFPYVATAFAFDVIALAVLVLASTYGRFRTVAVLICIAWCLSGIWHFICLVVTGFAAS